MMGLTTVLALLIAPSASALVEVDLELGLNSEGCAVTPGGWGAPPSGNNPGALLHEYFDDIFGDELVVGDLVFEDAQDVTDALPYTGQGGAFKSHAVALTLNIAFGDAGLLDGTVSDVEVESDNEALDGLEAWEILSIAYEILLEDDDIRNNEYSDLVEAMTGLNEEDFGCHEAPDCPGGVLALPTAEGTIHLSWNEVDDAVLYGVYRGTDGGDLVFIAATDELEFVDDTVAVGVAYEYMVTTWDGVLESEDCLTVVATAVPFFGAPLLGGVAVAGSVGAYAWMRKRK